MAAAARALSHSGEHGALWIAAGLLCAAADPERRSGWLRGTALIGAAHLASMGLKQVVRRPRPEPPVYEPLVRTASRHSFPSSHATSAAAAAVAFGALSPAGRRLVPPLAAAMCVSRLVVGVHYPTDVAAGALLGGLTAGLGVAWLGAGQNAGPALLRAPGRAPVRHMVRYPVRSQGRATSSAASGLRPGAGGTHV
ncbi:phosphatase PAP2 family protein [Streptomyces sp. NPDC054841]